MDLRGESARGMAWTAAGKIAVRGLQFAVGIVLARLLTPSDFGTVGVLGVFIAVSEMFIDCGFPLAYMRKLDRTDEDASTVFWFSLAMSAACYAALFAAAPLIAAFFSMPELKVIVPHDFEYAGERLCELGGVKYHILRTYITETDGIELTLQRVTGNAKVMPPAPDPAPAAAEGVG